jgi:hypothetical protein
LPGREVRKVKPEGEPEGLIEIIKYIQEREENLNRYSDKLRQSLLRIAQVFGSVRECQICNIVHFWDQEYDHEFKPKIHISIDINDQEPFLVEEGEEDKYSYYLQFWDGNLRIRIKKLIFTTNEERVWDWRYIDDASRYVLKQLVKSGRLPKFLEYVAQVLQEKGLEYGEAAEIASKMADAVNPKP